MAKGLAWHKAMLPNLRQSIITNAIAQRIFNHMFLTDCDGKLMIGTFNCVEKDIKAWEPISDQIVSSIKTE